MEPAFTSCAPPTAACAHSLQAHHASRHSVTTQVRRHGACATRTQFDLNTAVCRRELTRTRCLAVTLQASKASVMASANVDVDQLMRTLLLKDLRVQLRLRGLSPAGALRLAWLDWMSEHTLQTLQTVAG